MAVRAVRFNPYRGATVSDDEPRDLSFVVADYDRDTPIPTYVNGRMSRRVVEAR